MKLVEYTKLYAFHPVKAGRVADFLRSRGATYNDVMAFFIKHTDHNEATFEETMYKADMQIDEVLSFKKA